MTLALSISPAGAQNSTEVPRGESFSIQNANECEPNAEVRATLSVPDGSDRVIGSALADAAGHFSVDASMPGSTPLGSAVISVDCGLDDAVLEYEVEVVESTKIDYLDYAPYAAGGVGGLVLLVLIVGWIRDRPPTEKASKQDKRANKAAKKTAKLDKAAVKKAAKSGAIQDAADPPKMSAEPVAGDDRDGDADYWIWDNETPNGAVKRVACLTTDAFYLHEVPSDEFGRLLEVLDELGPDVALKGAFFSVPVAAIDEVHHRGTQLRVTYQDGGEKAAQVIDLGTEVDGVIDLLSRRVHVVADSAVPAP